MPHAYKENGKWVVEYKGTRREFATDHEVTRYLVNL